MNVVAWHACAKYTPAIAQLVEHLTVDWRRNQMVPGSIPGGRIFVHHERSESTARCVGRGRKMFAAVVCVSRWLRKIVIQEVRFFPAGSARFVFVWIPKVLREFEETKTTKNKADDIYG